MIDGIQIFNLPVSRETLLQNGIDFKSNFSHKSGETYEDKQTATLNGLFLTYYGIMPKRNYESIKLAGSINSFINGNNTMDLDFNSLISAINKLCRQLSINPAETVLNGFEIGVNIELPYNPELFLNELLAWGKIAPQQWTGKKENYIQFSASQVTLKIYSKSKQYDLSNNLLRYELRIDKMDYALKFGVKTLSDLMQYHKLQSLSVSLINTFDSLIYYDNTIDLDKLKKTDRNTLEKGNNPRYWTNSTLHRNTLSENRTKFQSLVRENGKQNFHLIKQAIESKTIDLLKNSVQNDQHKKVGEKQKTVQNYTLNNVSYRTCVVTHLPKVVSQQKGKYLTAKDVEYYYRNDKDIYKTLVEVFNSSSYKGIDYSKLPLEKRFEEIAHRIRANKYNRVNNTRNNTKRAIDKVMNEPTISMFNQWELISEYKKQLAGYS